jgi:ferredoxin
VSHSVTLQASGKRFRVLPGESILVAAQRAGLALPYSCLAGVCGSCKATLVSGECRYPRNPPLALDVGFGDRVEIHRVQAGSVDSGKPRRDVEAAEQRDGEVRIVAADALAGKQRARRTVGGEARPADVVEPGSHPRRHRRQQLGGVGDPGEFGVGGGAECVGLRIAARAGVDDEVGFARRGRRAFPEYRRLIPHFEPAHPAAQAVKPGAMCVADHVPVDRHAVESRREFLAFRLVVIADGDGEHEVRGLGDIQGDAAVDVALHVPRLACDPAPRRNGAGA